MMRDYYGYFDRNPPRIQRLRRYQCLWCGLRGQRGADVRYRRQTGRVCVYQPWWTMCLIDDIPF